MGPLVLRIAIVAAGAWAALAAFAFLLGERILFQPPPASYGPDDLRLTRVPVGGDGGAVVVQHLPNPEASHTLPWRSDTPPRA